MDLTVVDLQLLLVQSEMYRRASQHPVQLPWILCAGAATGTTVCAEVNHLVAFLRRPRRVVAVCCKCHRLFASSAATEVHPVQTLACGVPIHAKAAIEVPERVVVVEVRVNVVGHHGRERQGRSGVPIEIQPLTIPIYVVSTISETSHTMSKPRTRNMWV